MSNNRKHWGIERIVSNAEMLSDPVISDCFFYGDCEDPDGLAEVVDEIDDLKDLLPVGIGLLDLPNTYVGNKRTKIYGCATCGATEGHGILRGNDKNRVIFKDNEDPDELGYRSCKRCM